MIRSLYISSLLIVLTAFGTTNAQFVIEEYNHPELEWLTIETEHFVVHFHDGSERTARTVAGISEMIYEPITDLYNYEPEGKVHWIIRDHDDYANGAAYFYDQKIVLWATALDFELRGQHHWLYDVISHEFTHMIQLGAARKAPRWMPGLYLQYFGYEPEKRPDVLYGYPNRIVSYPLAGTVMPMWFAEGTAQYMVEDMNHDYWDSHRDMMLRAPVLADELMTWNQMGVFGKTSIGSERVYNHGYALVSYISDRWGEENIFELTDAMTNPLRVDFNGACKKVLGMSGKQLYSEWKAHLEEDYNSRTETIRANLRSGRVISEGGFSNLYPSISPDGNRVAFVSNEGADYMSLSTLKIYFIDEDSLTSTDVAVRKSISWSPDGKYIAYSSKEKADFYGSKYDDLFLYDVDHEETIRLTWQARLATPSFSPDGKQLVSVHNEDGTHNLAVLDLPAVFTGDDLREETSWQILTSFNDGTQIFSPRFTQDGENIYGSSGNLGPRDIFRYDIDRDEWKYIINSDYIDERDPVFSNDGNTLYWVDDHTGIFNIYKRDMTTLAEKALTNVTGSAFMPSLNADGSIAYSEFNEDGYSLRLLEEQIAVDPELMTYKSPAEMERWKLEMPPVVADAAKHYDTPFSSLFVLPRLYLDYGEVKPGFYAYTNDLLERINVFGGAAMAFNGDRDLYLNFTYRMFYPTLFIDIYNIVRQRDDQFDDNFVILGVEGEGEDAKPIYDKYSAEYKFNLAEYNIGARNMIADGYMASAIFRLSAYKAVFKFEDFIPIDYTYFRGRSYILRVDANHIMPSVGNDIHPRGGFKGWFEYSRDNNRFLIDFTTDAEKGTPLEVFKPYNYHRFETEVDYYYELFNGLVLNPKFIGGAISDSVDSFFHLYAGGLPGMRGYSFYSLGGRYKSVLRTAFRFPILTGIDRRFGPFYIDRINGAVFAEAGDAWNSSFDFENVKKDIGAELRLKLFSWYGYPTDIQFAGAYGLDEFSVIDESGTHVYGNNWRWYLSVLFDFL